VSAPAHPRDVGPETTREVRVSEVARLWAPLAISWLVMGLELPVVSAGLARLADPEIHLGAYGGVAFPLALIIEAPIIMLLAASTALARDMAAFVLMHRFMMIAGAALTALHATVAFTPLFDVVIVPLIGPPPELVEPARTALRYLLPFTWAIGYRRYHQGVLIRYGRARQVTFGTMLRLSAMTITLLILAAAGVQGVVVAAVSVIAGVLVEAAYIGVAARPVIRHQLARAPAQAVPLTWRRFGKFYSPLVLTMLVSMLAQPLGSAAISRMPNALTSLAVLPAVGGLLFMLRSVGIAFTEVVIALLDRPGAARALSRFTVGMSLALLAVSALLAFTPLSRLWFAGISGLNPELAQLAALGVAAAILWAPFDAIRSALQGRLTHLGRTSHVGESTVVFIVTSAVLLGIGVAWQRLPGLPYAMASFSLATLVQLGWLAWRSRAKVPAASPAAVE